MPYALSVPYGFGADSISDLQGARPGVPRGFGTSEAPSRSEAQAPFGPSSVRAPRLRRGPGEWPKESSRTAERPSTTAASGEQPECSDGPEA